MKTRKSHIGFLVPALLLYGTFVILPIAQSAIVSTLEWPGYGKAEFVGFSNYVSLFRDPMFYRALTHNVVLALASICFQLPIALALGLTFQSRGRLSSILRAFVFSPMILPSAVVAIMFMLLYEPLVGPLATLFRLDRFGFLGDEHWALPLLVIAISWRHIGFHMMLILAALQGVDRNLYEAAAVDGAGPARCLFHITLPAIAPTLVLSALLAVLGSLKYFDLVYIMSNQPETELLTTYLFRQGLNFNKFGYSAAIAMALLLISLICGILLQRMRRWRSA